MDPDTGSSRPRRLTSGQDTWSARCAETRTSGAASGSGKRTGRKASTAPRPDSTGAGGDAHAGAAAAGAALAGRDLFRAGDVLVPRHRVPGRAGEAGRRPERAGSGPI